MFACKICGNNESNSVFIAREMMFGFRDEFQYIECGTCGCLQLVEIPENIQKYYPNNYYSFEIKGEDHYIQNTLIKSVKRALKRKVLGDFLQGNGFVSKLVTPKYTSYYPWIKKGILKPHSAILDVGCGNGELLLRMYNDGFRNLKGADPFIKEDIYYKCGIVIHRKDIRSLTGEFDFIMLHHAFEHLNDPLQELKNICNLLSRKGIILIRIPVANSFAWRKYGVNWVQLDAPRHFFLHTPKSMDVLSEKAGLTITDIMYDSYAFQFIGSEKYIRDISLHQDADFLSQEQLRKFELESKRLNDISQGDQACFYLTKKTDL